MAWRRPSANGAAGQVVEQPLGQAGMAGHGTPAKGMGSHHQGPRRGQAGLHGADLGCTGCSLAGRPAFLVKHPRPGRTRTSLEITVRRAAHSAARLASERSSSGASASAADSLASQLDLASGPQCKIHCGRHSATIARRADGSRGSQAAVQKLGDTTARSTYSPNTSARSARASKIAADRVVDTRD